MLKGKELFFVSGDEEEAGGGVTREVRHVGMQEPCLVELGQTDWRPALGRSEQKNHIHIIIKIKGNVLQYKRPEVRT